MCSSVRIRAIVEHATTWCKAGRPLSIGEKVGAVYKPEGCGSHCALRGCCDRPACLAGVANTDIRSVHCGWWRWRRWWWRTQAAHLVVVGGASGGAGLRNEEGRLVIPPPVKVDAVEALSRAVVEHAAVRGKVEGNISAGKDGEGAVCYSQCLSGLLAIGVRRDGNPCLTGVANATVCSVR